jgi:predicted transcriptional regulator
MKQSLESLPPLSEAQLEIMNVVWDRGQCSVADVLEVLLQRRQVSRNTVQTMLIRLEEKGWLASRIEAGSLIFRSPIDRQEAQQHVISKVVDNVFDGSAEGMVLALLGSRKLDAAELERIRKLIANAKKDKS